MTQARGGGVLKSGQTKLEIKNTLYLFPDKNPNPFVFRPDVMASGAPFFLLFFFFRPWLGCDFFYGLADWFVGLIFG